MRKTLLVLVATLALAETQTAFAAPATPGVVRPRGLKIQVPIAAKPGVERPRVGPGLIIFMNRNGGTYYGTYNSSWIEDATSNQSTMFSGTRTIDAFPYGEATWQSVMACMREIYGPFNIEITDVDPGNIPHIESVVTSSPSEIGMDPYVGGVAPFTCTPIDNAIVWTFATVWGNSPRDICETAAQETAHAFGLDHEYLCQDPMTYLWGCGNKSFQNIDASCGEDGPRTCQCTGSSTQNSVEILSGIFGLRNNEPPMVRITQPPDGATVTQGFVVDVNASDDVNIDRVDLYIDGSLIGSDDNFPFGFTAPGSLGDGSHSVEVRAFDVGGLSAIDSVTVTIQPPCDRDEDCGQDYEVCISGRCVVGPDVDNGLGDRCETGADCFSGICGDGGNGEKYCVEQCQDACPDGYDCISAGGDTRVCWPQGGGGGGASGGCGVGAATSSGARLPLMLGVLFVGLFFAFRRRR